MKDKNIEQQKLKQLQLSDKNAVIKKSTGWAEWVRGTRWVEKAIQY